MEVIVERPKNMSYEEYRIARSENKKKIRRYLSMGRTYYVSWRYSEFEMAGVKKTFLQKFPPFVGSVRRDLRKPV